MALRCALLASMFLVTGKAGAGAGTPDARVVVVQVCVAEQVPERIETALTTPVEKLLLGLPGVETLNSNTSHGSASFEIHFKGGATEDDAASVTLAVDRSKASFLARSVRLDKPRADLLYSGQTGCETALR